MVLLGIALTLTYFGYIAGQWYVQTKLRMELERRIVRLRREVNDMLSLHDDLVKTIELRTERTLPTRPSANLR